MPLPGEWSPLYGTYMHGYGYTGTPQYQQNRANRDEEFFAKWGYMPGQGAANAAAQDAAEREWQMLVGELQNRISDIQGSEASKALERYYMGVMSGENLPYTPEVTASLTSRATNPMFTNAKNMIARLRDSFASRGLGRSIGSLETRYMTDAALGAGQEASRIRSQAALENFGARTGAASGLGTFQTNREGMLNSLASTLAQLRSQRSYDLGQFASGQNRSAPTTGGYTTTGYRPPPPQPVRRVGQTVPTYSFRN